MWNTEALALLTRDMMAKTAESVITVVLILLRARLRGTEGGREGGGRERGREGGREGEESKVTCGNKHP